MLYGSFVQDCVEFLMTIVIPVNKQHVLKSYKDLIDIKEDHLKELREWLDPLMKASLFMHYFNNEIDYLPHDLLQEIHSQTRLSGHLALDHILSLGILVLNLVNGLCLFVERFHRLGIVRVYFDRAVIYLAHGLDLHIIAPLSMRSLPRYVVVEVALDEVVKVRPLGLDVLHALHPDQSVLILVTVRLQSN